MMVTLGFFKWLTPVMALTLITSLATAAVPPPVTESLADRVDRLEKSLRSQQNLVELVTRIKRLQQEVQQLRGEMEEQRHTLEMMQKRQRNLYLDVDRRLQDMRSSSAPPTPAPLPPQISTPPVTPSPLEVPPAVVTANPAGEEAAYQQAFELLRNGHYPEAIHAFRTFLVNYPSGSYADNAQYWLAEASYVTQDFDTAVKEFGKVLSAYPNSSKVPDAMLKLGYIHYGRGEWSQARKLLDDLRKAYPSSSAARLAGQRLERMRAEGH